MSGSLADSVAAVGVPRAAMLDALRAFDGASGPSPPQDGDTFYVRWEQTYAVEGNPIGVGRVLWLELQRSSGVTLAIHRFRPREGGEQFFLTDGEAAMPPAVALPIDEVVISSRFGIRRDPLTARSSGGMGPLPPPRARRQAAAAIAAAAAAHAPAAGRNQARRARSPASARGSSCTRASISPCRRARRSMPRPTAWWPTPSRTAATATTSASRTRTASPPPTAISRASRRASSRAPGWGAASWSASPATPAARPARTCISRSGRRQAGRSPHPCRDRPARRRRSRQLHPADRDARARARERSGGGARGRVEARQDRNRGR